MSVSVAKPTSYHGFLFKCLSSATSGSSQGKSNSAGGKGLHSPSIDTTMSFNLDHFIPIAPSWPLDFAFLGNILAIEFCIVFIAGAGCQSFNLSHCRNYIENYCILK